MNKAEILGGMIGLPIGWWVGNKTIQFIEWLTPWTRRSAIDVVVGVSSGQSRGGLARAAKLSPQRRTEIARAAATARWKKAK